MSCRIAGVPDRKRVSVDTVAVRVAFDSLVARIARIDAAATLQSYDTTAGFAHVIGGELKRGRPAFDAWLTGMFPMLDSIDQFVIDSVQYIPVSADAVLMLAAYHEAVDSAGVRPAERGVWSNLFVRRPGGWKVVYGNSTHMALPAR
ncbi:MAG: hypothetical protein WEE89_21480 [Gemmatimonadota bacterium]